MEKKIIFDLVLSLTLIIGGGIWFILGYKKERRKDNDSRED